MGKLFLYGTSHTIKQNFIQAKRYLEEIANTGDDASFYLAIMHEHVLGTPVNIMKALKYYHFAKSRGYVRVPLLNTAYDQLKNHIPSYKRPDTNEDVKPYVLANFLNRFPSKSEYAAYIDM